MRVYATSLLLAATVASCEAWVTSNLPFGRNLNPTSKNELRKWMAADDSNIGSNIKDAATDAAYDSADSLKNRMDDVKENVDEAANSANDKLDDAKDQSQDLKENIDPDRAFEDKGIVGKTKDVAGDAKDYVKEKAVNAKDYVKEKAGDVKEAVFGDKDDA